MTDTGAIATSKKNWSAQEEAILAREHASHGNKWAVIARSLPGRTENDVKNLWHSTVRGKNIQRTSLLLSYARAAKDCYDDAASRRAAYDNVVQQLQAAGVPLDAMVFGGVVCPATFTPPNAAPSGSGSAHGGSIANGPASCNLQQQELCGAAGSGPITAARPALPCIVTTIAHGDTGSHPNSRAHTPSHGQRSPYGAEAYLHSDPSRGQDGGGGGGGGGMTFDELFEAAPLPHAWVHQARSPYSTSEVPQQYDSGLCYNDLPNSSSAILRATSSGLTGPQRHQPPPPLTAGLGFGLLVIDASTSGGGGGGGIASPFNTPTAAAAYSARRALRPASTLGLVATASGQTINAEAAANAFNQTLRNGPSSSASIGGCVIDAEAHLMQRLRLSSPAPSPRSTTSMGRQAGGNNTVEAVRAQQSLMLHRTISSPASRGSFSTRATSTGAPFVSGTVPSAHGGAPVGTNSGALPSAVTSVSGAAADGPQGGGTAGGDAPGNGPRLSQWLNLYHSKAPGTDDGGCSTPASAPQPYMYASGSVTAAAAGAAVAAQRQPYPPQHQHQSQQRQSAYSTLTQAAYAQQRQQRHARRMSQPDIVSQRTFSGTSTGFLGSQAPQPAAPTSEAGGYPNACAPEYGTQGGGIWVKQDEYGHVSYPADADAFMVDCGGRDPYGQYVNEAAAQRASLRTAPHAPAYEWQQQGQLVQLGQLTQAQQPYSQQHQQPYSQEQLYQDPADACDGAQAEQQGGWVQANGAPPSSASPSSATETTTCVTTAIGAAHHQHGGDGSTYQVLAAADGAGGGSIGRYPTSGSAMYGQQQQQHLPPSSHSSHTQPCHSQGPPQHRGSASWSSMPPPYGISGGVSGSVSEYYSGGGGGGGYTFPTNEVNDCVAALDVLLEDALEAEGGEPQIDGLLVEVTAAAEAGGGGGGDDLCYLGHQGVYSHPPPAGLAGHQAPQVVSYDQKHGGSGGGVDPGTIASGPHQASLTTASGVCVIDFSSVGSRPQAAGGTSTTGTASRLSLSRLGGQHMHQQQQAPAAAAAAALLMGGSAGPAPPHTTSLGSAGVGGGLYPQPQGLRTTGNTSFVLPGGYGGGGDTSTGVQRTISGVPVPAGRATSTGMGSLLVPTATDAGAVMGLGAAELAELGFGIDDVDMAF
ncbi:hypothetical protein HYH02_002485 [Chlamydomonas schloesseri]|uniref:Uncharacterized protein n=1 Tax=Chlamydomonas schloesseri TaxID=2026947 RepID=A0A836BBT1_9CHLO|nr:hypothetical protein HYH02_002485 [Chlamydomonas schloesseri]|eukprot:KAG2453159.1 hypothetical protein HYH02_002485 [Chlamydomonas schloesseri]